MDEIAIAPREIGPFAAIIGEQRQATFVGALDAARERLEGQSIWHVNSTAAGGGVAEMLQSVLSYPAAAGIDMHWAVIDGNEAFFELTKRLHHLLHGSSGDGGPLGRDERDIYEKTLAIEGEQLVPRISSGDVVLLHDPQVLGLAPALTATGARVLWNCHIGADVPNDETRRAWGFLCHYLDDTVAQIFSRPAYAWDCLDDRRVAVIPPCIDAFATKNAPLAPGEMTAILDVGGIAPVANRGGRATFPRHDGERGVVERRAELIEDAPLPEGARVVCQISRWDPLKDPVGLLRAFAEGVPEELATHLVLAGPAAGSVDDDPEAGQTLAEVVEGRRQLPAAVRRRVHLAMLPMDDVEENAAMVNALQRRAQVIVQKSLAEGFGLTVAEAMWKQRPVIGSRVGGIQDQIVDGETGVLIDATDGAAFGEAVCRLLRDHAASSVLGAAARERVIEEYLAPTYLTRQLRLVSEVLERDAVR